ncbi:HAMP domain-containing histidine kinase [Paenibacillus glycanilyticus]|uniref:sensor histidine kinase n=1 Tax=Paenibacillus glycanilyticus TaxID=126569 RepID=UPI00203A3A02|nr:HAMP domain-containing sensor histidine kinase [Paenibacillus glycanilyticus]MCM3627228.1 HAMP domain-containing histidine kinase [Paenibacillus glycanilyticus]
MRSTILLIAGIIVLIICSVYQIQHVSLEVEPKQDAIVMKEWDYQWLYKPGESFQSTWTADADPDKWQHAGENQPMPKRAAQADALLLRITLPSLEWNTSGVWLKRVYGTAVSVTLEQNDNPLYAMERSYPYDVNYILLPLTKDASGSHLLVLLYLSDERQSLDPEIVVGDYERLLPEYERFGLIELVYGGSFMFIALIMMTCLFFLKREQIVLWMSLCLFILCLGEIILAYSPALYHHFYAYGKPFLDLFDLALFLLTPALAVFFEQTLGPGLFGIIRKFRIALLPVTVIVIVLWALGKTILPAISLSLLQVVPLTVIAALQFLILTVHAIGYAWRGNRDAILISVGYSVFCSVFISEIIIYFKDETYHLIYWKWGLLVFLLSLIAVMGRQFSRNHDQLVKYSRELEMFNREIQRSEKMELISHLAASIAHEIRNPLQVTRGFVQLVGEKAENKDRQFLNLAVQELDRASSIITEFLTFAKPELDDIKTLNISEELYQIQDIISPLAAMQSTRLEVVVEPNLHALGSAEKFKQAIINMIKNSLEAITSVDGAVSIQANKQDDHILIRVTDNGEGIDEEKLDKLGEPYFSNKSKGTGLGLMVTFRIIEAMEGTIRFSSTKGVGTEAVIRLPAIDQ